MLPRRSERWRLPTKTISVARETPSFANHLVRHKRWAPHRLQRTWRYSKLVTILQLTNAVSLLSNFQKFEHGFEHQPCLTLPSQAPVKRTSLGQEDFCKDLQIKEYPMRLLLVFVERPHQISSSRILYICSTGHLNYELEAHDCGRSCPNLPPRYNLISSLFQYWSHRQNESTVSSIRARDSFN